MGVDFEDFSGSFSLTGTQTTFAPVNIIDDSLLEGPEIFFGNLVGQLFDNIDYYPILANATIVDDESTYVLMCFLYSSYEFLFFFCRGSHWL